MTSHQQFEAWLLERERENLEFKEAKSSFEFEKLVDYCAALANEGGGCIVLGVTDKLPRKVVGTAAFSNLERTKAGLLERLAIRVSVDELVFEGSRVLIFTSPARPIGRPIADRGTYWMRAGQDLVPMSSDQLKRIFDEGCPDFSATVCPGATLDDLSPAAIEIFRSRWHRKSRSDAIRDEAPEQLLRDAELLSDEGVTYAALILLGKQGALGRLLAQAEVVFEYRSSEAPGPASQREEFRQGLLLYYDRLWELVNLRNDLQHYQDGLFVLDIATFDERSVREAILNALSHRDYQHGASIFIRQYARRIEIVSPGGLPPGITLENLLWQQNPRNRRIAEALARCGLVERSGQGFDLIYSACIRHSKPLPDFSRTDEHFVALTLQGEIQDPEFLRYLEKVGRETQTSFDTRDLLILDLVHRGEAPPAGLQKRTHRLVELGALESVGRGRGTRLLLSRSFFRMVGKAGGYTRRKGLDRETHKALLVKHLVENPGGTPLAELHQVLPHLSTRQVQALLKELRGEGRIHLRGQRRWGRWVAARAKNGTESRGS